MRRLGLIAGLAVVLLLLAGLGASISLVRNALSLPFERSTTA
jgi:hypothetical protein